MQDLDNKYLMMIEPPMEDYTEEPVEDEITMMADVVMKGCRRAKVGYKGTHKSVCGKRSDNHDRFTLYDRITHTLMPHYVRHFRKSIPESELKKLREEYDLIARNSEKKNQEEVTRRRKEFLKRATELLERLQS